VRSTKLYKYQFCVPSACALSHPRPLLHRPRAPIKFHNAHATGTEILGWNHCLDYWISICKTSIHIWVVLLADT